MDVKKIIAKLGVTFSRFVVLIYDVISFPVFVILDQPWRRWKMQKIIWSKLEREDDPHSCYIRQIHHPDTHLDGVNTMDELFRNAVAQHRHSKCFGTREVLGEEEITVKSGKIFKKLSLGEYKWMTYEEVDRKVEVVSRGLLSLGLKSKMPVVLLAETRVEWNITAQACFRINVPVVTLYATLGEDGLAHGINETEVTHIITSTELLPKLKKVFHLLSRITHVIYLEGREAPSLAGIPESVKVSSFTELQEAGRNATDDAYSHFEPPQPTDLAILMYTSGSTGIPKGVMITNKNVISTTRGFIDVLGTSIIRPNDVYIAYLPLAHVLELAAECYLSSLGIPIGFSSPQTLTDFSTALKKGCKGDLKILQPTLMAAVPLMLDRIRKSILTLAGQEGTFSRLMFDFAIEYKHFWTQRGFRTPVLDRKLLNTYHEFLGGRLKYMLCGGAPLSHDTQDFIRSCLDIRVIQGYGMTETAASSSLTDIEDFSTGRVGAPLSTCKIRLVDWDEGGYHVTDKPHPRGEIVVGGDSVTLGYFKNETQTQESFKDENGIRWFYTGDIGEVMPDGTFKIIDRKKDLVKLQFGEYVALGKVEAELKTCPLVENICAFGSGLHSYLVALVVPNSFHLTALAKEMGKEHLTFTELCEDQAVVAKAAQKIREYGQKCRLFGSELPAKVKLCTEEWMPESGLVTAAFKLRRKMIQQHYQHAIEEMYATDTPNGTTKST